MIAKPRRVGGPTLLADRGFGFLLSDFFFSSVLRFRSSFQRRGHQSNCNIFESWSSVLTERWSDAISREFMSFPHHVSKTDKTHFYRSETAFTNFQNKPMCVKWATRNGEYRSRAQFARIKPRSCCIQKLATRSDRESCRCVRSNRVPRLERIRFSSARLQAELSELRNPSRVVRSYLLLPIFGIRTHCDIRALCSCWCCKRNLRFSIFNSRDLYLSTAIHDSLDSHRSQSQLQYAWRFPFELLFNSAGRAPALLRQLVSPLLMQPLVRPAVAACPSALHGFIFVLQRARSGLLCFSVRHLRGREAGGVLAVPEDSIELARIRLGAVPSRRH